MDSTTLLASSNIDEQEALSGIIVQCIILPPSMPLVPEDLSSHVGDANDPLPGVLDVERS